jgi:probable rRNA maturation factor
VNVFFADEQDHPLDVEPLRNIAAGILEEEGLPPETEVAVVLVGPKEMADYNERFMNRRGPTDVLAFPLEEFRPGRPPVAEPNGPPLNLGDVFICPSVVRDNSEAAGVAFDDEMALMVVHGLLHLLGYDHTRDEDAKRMELRERRLLELVTKR